MKNNAFFSFVFCAVFCLKSCDKDNNELGDFNKTYTDPRDGQTYKTVKIGDQVWFAENLNYEMDSSVWYEHEQQNGEVYGRLYTWNAALNACPEGWHLPTDEEWKTLEMELGLNQNSLDSNGYRGAPTGRKLKSDHGWYNEGNGSNSSGFNALPGGYASEGNEWFFFVGQFGCWWTATGKSETGAWTRGLYFETSMVRRESSFKNNRYSVRCIKD
jgi:uncharacterized protein (TIGR02145 family)